MNIGFEISLEQKQQLSQSQIQSLAILAMDTMELNQFLQNEYLENPLLDHKDSGTDKQEERSSADESFREYGQSGRRDQDEDSVTRDIPCKEAESVEDYVLQQLAWSSYSETEWNLIRYMTECLDDTGFFTMPVTEVAGKQHVSCDLVEMLLEELRQLEPYGIFASDLKHCFLKQLEAMNLKDTDVWVIVDRHLDDVANGKISNITRAEKLSTAEVRKCINQIVSLNPRPLSGFDIEKTQYVIPDIRFHEEKGEWRVELNDEWVRDYKLNDYYLHMMKESKDGELTEYFRNKLMRVQFLLNSIEQRRHTIISISELIIEKQKHFLRGQTTLQPMTMEEVANELHVHTSTVSRAVRGKYIEYPHGSIYMKNLFSASVSKGAGETEVSPMEVKKLIREMIETEDSRKPYSDQHLKEALDEKGIHISRRAVAKYREEMRIKTSYARKTE